jgi:hypothetical protein
MTLSGTRGNALKTEAQKREKFVVGNVTCGHFFPHLPICKLKTGVRMSTDSWTSRIPKYVFCQTQDRRCISFCSYGVCMQRVIDFLSFRNKINVISGSWMSCSRLVIGYNTAPTSMSMSILPQYLYNYQRWKEVIEKKILLRSKCFKLARMKGNGKWEKRINEIVGIYRQFLSTMKKVGTGRTVERV